MSMLRGYLRVLLFALGLLVGVQVPGFIDDYTKQLAARQDESEQSLLGFRQTAARFFQGDLNALIRHYQTSQDAVVREDAQSLARLKARADLLDAEWLAMQGPWYAQLWHLASAADRSLLEHCWQSYSYQLLLTPFAIAWGLGSGLLLALLLESLLLGFAWTLGYGRTHKTIAYEKRHWR